MIPIRFISFFALVWMCATARAQTRTEAFTEPFHTVEIAPAEPGILARLFVEEGDVVKVGDALAELDSRVLEIGVKIARQAMQSQGRLKAARAEHAIKAQRLEKLKALKLQGYAFQDELERAATDVEVAEANRSAAEEQQAIDTLQLEKAEAELELRKLRSPIDGVVVKVHHELREFISTPDPVVITVVQLNPLRVVFPVPTADAVKLSKNQTVTVRFPETEVETLGRVEIVSPVTDAESGLVRVKVLVANPDGRFRSGIRVSLSFDATPSSTAAVVKP